MKRPLPPASAVRSARGLTATTNARRRRAALLFAAAAAALSVGLASSLVATEAAPASSSLRAATEARAAAVRAHQSFAPLPAGVKAASTHDPFGSEDCAACHASGDKNAPGPVEDKSAALCLKCHDDPGAEKDVPFAHQHGGKDGRCLDCHNPHDSAQELLLHAPPERLCATCHVDKTRGAVEHAPLKTAESCTKCHTPHGSNAEHLLTAPFPPSFYAPYSREAYALCFGCHDVKLVEERFTRTATRFRDGDKNLHAVHVMRDDGKGRTCGACHDLHAGKRENLVHDDVAFGSHGWRLPLGFTATADGGSCAKTCHMTRSYDRSTR